jgi:hypothetical protein
VPVITCPSPCLAKPNPVGIAATAAGATAAKAGAAAGCVKKEGGGKAAGAAGTTTGTLLKIGCRGVRLGALWAVILGEFLGVLFGVILGFIFLAALVDVRARALAISKPTRPAPPPADLITYPDKKSLSEKFIK